MKTIRECIQSKKKRSMEKVSAQANKIKLNRCATYTDIHWRMTNIANTFNYRNISESKEYNKLRQIHIQNQRIKLTPCRACTVV